MDLFPTLVELCHVPSPAGLEGHSLAPILRDAGATVQRGAFTQHPRPAYYDREPGGQPKAMGVSVRTARVRYTEWREWGTGKVLARELYGDDEGDRAEMRNRVDDAELREAQAEAEGLLRERFGP
jgi:iduronate 2-sulfatase